ncbi:MAG: formate dehydrogenase family accessory protein FdhD [Caulobacteraceae bacterium]|nr:formate dehydrogenase family accessory protein FdhD [Caulobacteraceae bacterium]
MSAGPSPFEARPAWRWRQADGAVEAISRDLPAETAVGLAYDSAPYVVVMASPADIEDLAVGFTVTERVAPFAAIERVTVSVQPEGLLADVLLSKSAGLDLALARRRTLESRSSCGLCGVETLREAVRPIAAVGAGPTVTRAAIQRALEALETGQSLGARTRATHAAAWADAEGRVRLVREDVGRHNALDKLAGAALRQGLDPGQAFILVTSRCSYEMVEKAAAAGVSILVAISAPTALAIAQAEAAGLTLVALARADGHTVFAGGQRIAAG